MARSTSTKGARDRVDLGLLEVDFGTVGARDLLRRQGARDRVDLELFEVFFKNGGGRDRLRVFGDGTAPAVRERKRAHTHTPYI